VEGEIPKMQSDGKFSNENTEEIDLEKPDGPLSKKKKEEKKKSIDKKQNKYILSLALVFLLFEKRWKGAWADLFFSFQ
jgi:hypothetical protein